MEKGAWFEKSFRRSLLDMHVEDWDSQFLSQYNPSTYVELLKSAHVQTAMMYANSQVGCCYWPTKVGHAHNNTKDKDILGELIQLCHKEGMDVVLYYTLIFNNREYDRNPSSRIVDLKGVPFQEKGYRYGLCCPNSKSYRNFVEDQIKELSSLYSFEGLFFDMAFWPEICYCQNCKNRFAEEIGGDIPEIIDWNNERWLIFQKKRIEWLAEFALFATSTAKKFKPGITVEHNSATFTESWKCGTAPELLVDANDYLGGDFYGGWLEQSFICKLYASLTHNKPFEYMTSVCYPDVSNHTSIKSVDRLALHAYLALAHAGAFLFIDAIDPVGTQNPEVYQKMGVIFAETQKYEVFLFGELCQDVAVYFSSHSKYDHDAELIEANLYKGKSDYPHLKAALGASRVMKENHIPFGVIGKRNLENLKGHKVIVLPYVTKLDKEEAEQIRQFVFQGGSLYVSGNPSSDMMKEIAGLEFEGTTEEDRTYIRPLKHGEKLMAGIHPDYPLSIFNKQAKVKPLHADKVLAVSVLPYTPPQDKKKFASIHSNPPGKVTQDPAVIYTNYGEGKVIWVSAPLEEVDQDQHKHVFVQMIRELAGNNFLIEAEAPACVEVLVLHQEEQQRYVISLVNEQEQLPLNPIYHMQVKLKLNGKKVRSVHLLPSNEAVAYQEQDGYAVFKVNKLDMFSMFALNYENYI